ncbi:MAG: efflux RND transporter periplasmic adaptor subunit, partial [Oscillospiraceae bacterium]|nr:efflux RND transporter periplasmic adaptor subunit [Oscillospiraceae bacterium]
VVTEVDRTANSKAGVTSYSAEVTFDKSAGMLTGMTANVNINIVGTENVLLVPQDAVQRTSTGAFVYTEYDENTKTLGGEVPVEVGIENSDSAEIVSGIEEGTVVYYNEKPKDFMDIMMMSAYG